MLGRVSLSALGSAVLAVVLAATTAACDVPFASTSASDNLTPPKLGACRDLVPGDLTKPSNDTAPIACTTGHTAQTFAIGTLPAATGKGYDDPRHGRFVYGTCQKAFAEFLGADESLAMRSRLSWAWFRPSERGWDKGARWYRCDLVGGPADATKLRHLPEDAQGLFSESLPDAWLTCARGPGVGKGTKVACTEKHDWRAVTTVKVGQPDDPYPGDRLVQVRSRDYCQESVGGWMHYPPDYDYGYTWFREAQWATGNRRSICWARTDR
ncbi:septum formation family protein [Marmoricola sp. RAF53]|uniref:septum formation family protein n=1 Tax=Marmoricola sp. RAF53 TaxID=3233059 RepID=UPI003F99D1AC